MDTIFQEFGVAFTKKNGYQLAGTLNPELSSDMLRVIYRTTNHAEIKAVLKREIRAYTSHLSPAWDHEDVQAWVEVYAGYWKVCGEILATQGRTPGTSTASWTKVYEAWKEVFSALHRGYMNYGFPAWTIPCLYMVGKYLRVFAIRADEERSITGQQETQAISFGDDLDLESEKYPQLRDCGVQLNRMFTLCLNDREPLEHSRKWAIFNVGNLLFRTYFKLKTPDLCKNVLRALTAGRGDMPPFEGIPKSQQVIFKYHQGVLEFLEENYPKAEEHLTLAWNLCHKDAMRNKELILTYLIPCHLITTATLPSKKLLEPYPELQKLFLPLCGPIKKGELHAFDLALQDGEDEFVKRRIYLTLERGRDIALRNLLRKVFLVGGFEEPKEPGAKALRRTRVPLDEFAAAISLGSQEKLDSDEVECLLANMIYKGYMKGYISRAHNIVVLSKTGAFPPTGV